MRQHNKPKTGLRTIRVKYSWFVMLLLGSSIACIPQNAGNSTPTLLTRSQTAPTIPASQSLTEPAKTTIIQVKGISQTVALSSAQVPSFSTNFPTERFTKVEQGPSPQGNSAEGIGFVWKKPDGTLSKNALITLVLYDKTVTLREMRKQFEEQVRINEKEGMRRVKQGSDLSYAKAYSPWLRDVVRLESGSKESRNVADSKNDSVATFYLGEAEGRVLLVISIYLRQEEAEFTPRADVILKNLKFESKK